MQIYASHQHLGNNEILTIHRFGTNTTIIVVYNKTIRDDGAIKLCVLQLRGLFKSIKRLHKFANLMLTPKPLGCSM